MNTLTQAEIADAIGLFEQFRDEFIQSLSENFFTKHAKLKIGSGASVLTMMMAFGVANLHEAIVKTAIGATLDDGDLLSHHRTTGALIYRTYVWPKIARGCRISVQ